MSTMRAQESERVPEGHIETTSGVCGGKPRVRGTRIKVSEIAWRHVHDGQSADAILEAFPHLGLAQVHAALAYYFDHQDEVEAELHSEAQVIQELMNQDRRRGPRPA
jgi:uncharacterized protein (DUF433 family)